MVFFNQKIDNRLEKMDYRLDKVETHLAVIETKLSDLLTAKASFRDTRRAILLLVLGAIIPVALKIVSPESKPLPLQPVDDATITR